MPTRAGGNSGEALAGGNPGAAPSVAASAAASTSTSVVTSATSPGGASLDAYQGLGTWIDIYDSAAWRDPAGAVAAMKARGVRTLFIETANYNSPNPLYKPDKLRKFIAEGHAHGIKVVAWYLPNMKTNSVDYARVMQAIRLRTADGQQFDSFALDIESSAVSSEWKRNRGLEALSRKIRAAVGPTYPLGAITPSPVGLKRPHSVWGNFPYTMLAGIYDVFVPMGYYTYHGHSASAAYADARANMRIIRAQPGCLQIPVHLIGGIAEESSDEQTAGFVRGVLESNCIGASVYGFPGTSGAAWRSLSAIKP
jgi:hypothetical protein